MRRIASRIALSVGAALVLAAVLGGCGKKPAAQVAFQEKRAETGIEFWHTDGSSGQYFITETIASGVTLWDYDQDGRIDIYFPNGRPIPPGYPWAKEATRRNALSRNEGNGPTGVPRFVDVTDKAGVPGTDFGVAGTAADYDGDGDLDLFVTQLGPDVLYRNRGDGTFEDVAKAAGVADPAFGGCAAFGDIDRDGWLDLYVCNYCYEDFNKPAPCSTNGIQHYCAPNTFKGVPHSLFRNKGDGTFADLSETSNIRKYHMGKGLGVRFCDFDDDGYPEIYVANDGSQNFLFHNQCDLTFENIGLQAGCALDMNGDEMGSMGVDIADYDSDGKFDIVVMNYQKQAKVIYHNEGNLLFTEVGMKAGIAANSLPLVSWGTRFLDYDNDGILDLFIANGHLEDRIDLYDQSSTYLQQNQLFRGTGEGTFVEISNSAGPGLLLKNSHRGCAFGDIDSDGDTDIVVCCSRRQPLVLLNEGGNLGGNWVQILLTGTKPNLFAIGAKVTVRAGKRTQIQEVRTSSSYAGQDDPRLHFGLGSAGSIDRIEVRWPDGRTDVVTGASINKVNRIAQGRGLIAEGAKVAAQ
jgi:hypothetical protein